MGGDFVALPQLRCEVAQAAVDAWHDDIKNGLLWWSDDARLARRLRDASTMRQLEDRVRRVCRDVRGLSGALLVRQLPPLAELPVERRLRLVRMLDRAFENDFRPDDVARELDQKLDALLELVRDFLARDGELVDAKPRLDEIRRSARFLGVALVNLPRGFWLPRRLAGDKEGSEL